MLEIAFISVKDIKAYPSCRANAAVAMATGVGPHKWNSRIIQ